MLNKDHSKINDTSTFFGSAGKEELKHLRYLIGKLSDKQIAELSNRVGISFGGVEVIRESYETALDEADREVFYREYHKLLDPK